MINIGIDNGNYNTKSSDGFMYPSGFIASSQPPVGEADYLRSGDTFYALGAKRAPVQYDKTRNNDAWILTLAMLAHALRKRELTSGKFRLGVGLPLMAYAAQHDAMRAYFMNRKAEDFAFCGQEYSISIEDCHVYPQGYAAYLTQYRELVDHNSITHVDIGGYTIDFFRTQGGRLVPGSMTSIPKGTVSMMRTIQSELARDDILLDEAEITAAMQGGRVEHVRAEEAARAIYKARDRYVQDICNTLREYGIDTQTPINLIGGGAELLVDALKECMYVVGTADMFANARGYALWLEREI